MVRWTGTDRTRARSIRARACSNRTKARSNRTRARSDRMRARTVDVCVGQARPNVVGHDSGGCYRDSSCEGELLGTECWMPFLQVAT